MQINRLSHKKVNEAIAKTLGLSYYKGNGGITPTNYTVFTRYNSKSELEEVLQIEVIPAKTYMKTIYIMFISATEEEQALIAKIAKEEYRKQTEGKGVKFCLDFNNKEVGILF